MFLLYKVILLYISFVCFQLVPLLPSGQKIISICFLAHIAVFQYELYSHRLVHLINISLSVLSECGQRLEGPSVVRSGSSFELEEREGNPAGRETAGQEGQTGQAGCLCSSERGNPARTHWRDWSISCAWYEGCWYVYVYVYAYATTSQLGNTLLLVLRVTATCLIMLTQPAAMFIFWWWALDVFLLFM